jgi:hypothetical protein
MRLAPIGAAGSARWPRLARHRFDQRTQSSQRPGIDLLEVRRGEHGSDLAGRRRPTIPASHPEQTTP